MRADVDHRKKRKNEQRQKTMLIMALAGVFFVSLILSALALSYTGGESGNNAPLIPLIEPSLNEVSPTPFVQPLETSTIPIESTEMPAQVPLPLSAERLAAMTFSEKIGQMLMVGVDGMELSPIECQMINDIMPGGIAFHGGNVTSPTQIKQLIDSLKACLGTTSHPPMFFAIDHEGQYINRFDSGVTVFPCALAQGATGDPLLAYQSAFASGQELSSMGFNMILGPDADVLTNMDNLVIGERSFGGNPQQVGTFVASAVKGYQQAGLIPVIKHFPGHGGVSVDSHNALPVDNSDLQTISNVYLPPFSQGLEAGAPVVMLSHVTFPQIDAGNLPASLSKPTIDLLRTQLDFDGVVLTDDLNMGALKTLGLDVPTIALASVRAGSDMLLILPLSDAQSAKKQIQTAVEQGIIPLPQIDSSALRILRAKERAGILWDYPIASQPDWQGNANLAYSVGYRSVAILKNLDGLVPIPSTVRSILVIAPPDNLGLDSVLNSEMQARGIQTQFIHYYSPWQGWSGDDDLTRSFVAQAGNFDLTIIFTWQAHANQVLNGDHWQGQLVNTFQQGNLPFIVVSLKSPTDILEFSSASTYLASFGTTSGQIQSLVDILTGKSPASGVNPLPQLP